MIETLQNLAALAIVPSGLALIGLPAWDIWKAVTK